MRRSETKHQVPKIAGWPGFGAHAVLFHELAHLLAQSVEIHALGSQDDRIGDLDRTQRVTGFEMQGVAQRFGQRQLPAFAQLNFGCVQLGHSHHDQISYCAKSYSST